MKFTISPEIFEKFPDLHIGIIFARNIQNSGENPEIINMIRAKESEIRSQHALDNLGEIPKIAAWRSAYSSFGAKPKKYKCSVENLYRMILEGIDLRHINTLVDIYNFISLKHLIPVGGDDLDKVEGNIMLTIAKGDEPFRKLNSEESEFPHPGEIVYRDDKEVLCRRWNWRECEKSKMTEETKNAMLVIEGIPPVSKSDVEEITKELGEMVQRFCSANISRYILDLENPEFIF
ncbi:hypothetical protein HZA38_01730 [Candidatus Peregrinibacteria bacterium]|nr:hypothetical protein [Candidatus Peregrinibacteria bacterium]